MTRDGPWTSADVALLLIGDAVGLGLILIAWYRTSGQLTPSRQTAWIAGGAAGIILAGVVNGAWLVRARRVIGVRRARSVLRPIELLAVPRPVLESLVVSVPGAHRYHRPSCPLVSGKIATPATAEDELGMGRQPCGVCAP